MGLLRRQQLAHFVALEPIGLLQAGAEGHRSQLLAAPILPASSLVSTASIYSERSPVGIRGSSASGGSAAVHASLRCHESLAPSRSQGFVKQETTRSRVLASRFRTRQKARAPRPTPVLSVLQTTKAKLMPRNLTRASSGLAAARR